MSFNPSPNSAIVGLLDDVCDEVRQCREENIGVDPAVLVIRCTEQLSRKGLMSRNQANQFLNALGAREPRVIPIKSYPRVYRHVVQDQEEARRVFEESLSLSEQYSKTTEEAYGDWEVNGVRAIKFPTTSKAVNMNRIANWWAWERVLWKVSHGQQAVAIGGIQVERVGRFFWLSAGGVSGLVCGERLAMFATVADKRAKTDVCRALGVLDQECIATIEEVDDWQDHCLELLGNPGFEIGKGVEAAGRCAISYHSGGDVGIGGLDDLLSKYQAKVDKLGAGDLGIIEGLERIAKGCGSVDAAVEMFGSMKRFGHPTIDIRAGGRAQQLGRDKTKSYVSAYTMEDLRGCLQELAVVRYIKRTGTWPPFNVSPEKDSPIYPIWLRRAVVWKDGEIRLSDWAKVQVGKVDSVYEPTVWTDILDDKSIADRRENIESFWTGKGKARRRLYSEMLSTQNVRARTYIELAKTKWLDDEDISTGLIPKQEEHKCKGRFFSVEPAVPRNIMKISEATAARMMGWLFEETSMVMTRAQFETRAQTSFNVLGKEVFGELDLSDWNILWEKANTAPIMRDLSAMIGEDGFFEFQHWYFTQSLVHMRVPGYKLRRNADGLFDDDDLAWGPGTTNRLYNDAGHEGKQQKPWTIITGLVAMVVGKRHPALNISLMIQGDNLTCKISRKDGKRVEEWEFGNYIGDMARTFKSIGQNLKPEESVFSRTTATYSKMIWVAGVEKASSIKWVSSLKTKASGVPWNIATAVSILGSSCAAISSRLRRPHVALSIYWFLTRFSVLTLSDISSRSHGFSSYLDEEDFWYLVRLPSSLGGHPVLTCASTIIRGAADPSSNEISDLRRHARVCSRSHSLLNNFVEHETLWSKSPDTSKLIADPYSLPLDLSGSLKSTMREVIKNNLAVSVENSEVAELLELEQESGAVRGILGTARPMYAALMRGVADCCGSGIADRVVSRFTNSSTFASISGGNREVSQAILNAYDRDVSMRLEWVRRLKCLRGSSEQLPSGFELVCSFRQRWGLGYGSFSGVSNISPIEAVLNPGGTLNTIGAACLGALEDSVRVRGRFPVYFGKSTREKRTETGFVVEEEGSVVDAVKKLALISSQLDPGANLKGFLNSVAKEVCGSTLSELEPYLPRITGGTAAHRYDDDRKSSFHINVLPGPASHFLISSNNAQVLKDDIPLAVQEFYICAVHILSLVALEGAMGSAIAFLQIPLAGANPVTTASPELPEKHEVPFSINRSNPLVAIDKITLAQDQAEIPGQWVAQHPTPSNPTEVVRSLLVPSMLRSVEARTLFVSSDVSMRSLELDLAEFVAIPFDNLIREAGRAVAVTSVYGTVLSAISSDLLYHKEVFEENMVERSLAISSALGSYFGMEDPTLASIRRKYGLVVESKLDGGRGREKTIAALIYGEAQKVASNLEAPMLLPTHIPAELDAAVVVTRAWVFCELYQRELRRGAKGAWSRIRKVCFTALKAEGADRSASRTTNIVAHVVELSTDGSLPNVNRLLTSRRGPAYRSLAGSADLRRSLRGMGTPAVGMEVALEYQGGEAPWFKLGRRGMQQYVPGAAMALGSNKFSRLLLRRCSEVSSLTSTFIPIGRSILNSSVLHIGAGSGGWSYAFASLGSRVWEIDLLSTRPRMAQEFLTLTSPGGQLSLGEVKVHDATFSGGDIFSEEVGAAMCRHRGLVLVDVQTFPIAFDYPRVLENLTKCKAWAIRVLCKGSELKWLADTYNAVVCLISIEEKTEYVDAVLSNVGELSEGDLRGVTPATPLSPLAHYQALLRRLMSSVVGKALVDGPGSTDLVELMKALVSAEKRAYKLHKGGHNERLRQLRDDRFLVGVLGLVLGEGSNEAAAELLERISRTGVVETPIGTYSVSAPAMGRILCEGAARLIAILGRLG